MPRVVAFGKRQHGELLETLHSVELDDWRRFGKIPQAEEKLSFAKTESAPFAEHHGDALPHR